MNAFTTRLLTCVLLLGFGLLTSISPAYANVALPRIFYLRASLVLLTWMLVTDGFVFFTFLKLTKEKISVIQFILRTIVIFIIGIISDIFALILSDRFFQIVFPDTSNAHQFWLEKYTSLFNLHGFYNLGYYLEQFTWELDMYKQPAGILVLFTTAFIALVLLNLTQKIFFNITTKLAVKLAIFIAFFTNPLWGTSITSVLIWIGLIVLTVAFKNLFNKKII